jgi:RNA recognition motif-containing protein
MDDKDKDYLLYLEAANPDPIIANTPLLESESEDNMLTSQKPDYSANTAPAARRSRSPTRDRENNSSYRDQRSPAANNYDRSDRRPSRSEQPNMEDRQNSQQDRRVYVGNLSYDVKWHHLKDHMREGMANSPAHSTASLRDTD